MLAIAQRSDHDSAVAEGREPASDTRTVRIEQLGREPARVAGPGEAPTPDSPDGAFLRAIGRRPLQRLLAVFVLCTAVGLGLVLHRAGGLSFVLDALVRLARSPSTLSLLVVLLGLEWYSDYLRYRVLARHLGVRLPFGLGIEIVFANLLFSYLTPGATFGAPATIYMMRKQGVPLSRAIALSTIKPFAMFFVMLASGSVIFIVADLPFSAGTRRVILLGCGIAVVLTAMVISLVFLPQRWRRVVEQLVDRLRARRLRRGVEPSRRFDRITRGLYATLDAFALFGRSGWRGIMAALGTTVLNMALFIAVSVVLLDAVGFELSAPRRWLLSYVYCFLIVFSPTPGASGLAEGGGYVLFEAEAPAEVVGSYVVLWRFVSCYLVMVIGSLLFVRFLRRVHGRAALVGSTGNRCLP